MSIQALAVRWRRVAEIWPLMTISLGIVLSFAWAVVVIWFLALALASFT